MRAEVRGRGAKWSSPYAAGIEWIQSRYGDETIAGSLK